MNDNGDDNVRRVKWGDPALMGFCSVCNTNPCNGVDHYFGVCPVCHKTDGYINVGKAHVYLCETHKLGWVIGSNLFSCWKYETQEEQRTQQERLGFAEYRIVEPHYAADCESDTDQRWEQAAEAIEADPELR